MHYQTIINKIKTVRLRFVWIGDHLLAFEMNQIKNREIVSINQPIILITNKRELNQIFTKFGRDQWEFINMFTSVDAVRNTKTEIKIERFEQCVLEIMPFDHSKTIDWFRSDVKLYTGNEKKKKNLICVYASNRIFICYER